MPVSDDSWIHLSFPLDVEDGWPPVPVETLPFRPAVEGYIAAVPPLFVKDLSVGDVIDATLEEGSSRVSSWRHRAKSGHSTIWLLRMRQSATIDSVLGELRSLGCHTVRLEEAGAYSIDVPETVAMSPVDAALAELDELAVAVAFPSMRHPE
jgi:Domain of unknown function (DUF4265)